MFTRTNHHPHRLRCALSVVSLFAFVATGCGGTTQPRQARTVGQAPSFATAIGHLQRAVINHATASSDEQLLARAVETAYDKDLDERERVLITNFGQRLPAAAPATLELARTTSTAAFAALAPEEQASLHQAVAHLLASAQRGYVQSSGVALRHELTNEQNDHYAIPVIVGWIIIGVVLGVAAYAWNKGVKYVGNRVRQRTYYVCAGGCTCSGLPPNMYAGGNYTLGDMRSDNPGDAAAACQAGCATLGPNAVGNCAEQQTMLTPMDGETCDADQTDIGDAPGDCSEYCSQSGTEDDEVCDITIEDVTYESEDEDHSLMTVEYFDMDTESCHDELHALPNPCG